MRKKFAILFVGLILVSAGSLFAFDQFTRYRAEEIAIDPAPECNSCTARHQAFSRAKKLRDKNKPTLAGKTDRTKPLRPSDIR